MRAAPILGLTVDQLIGPWENGPRVVALTEERLSALVRDAVAEGVEQALQRLGAGSARNIAS